MIGGKGGNQRRHPPTGPRVGRLLVLSMPDTMEHGEADVEARVVVPSLVARLY